MKLKQTKSAIIPDKVEDKKAKVDITKFEAVVYNGNYKFRSYNFNDNWENFEELARDFAAKKSTPSTPFTVKLEEIKQGIKCPSCGHIIEA